MGAGALSRPDTQAWYSFLSARTTLPAWCPRALTSSCSTFNTVIGAVDLDTWEGRAQVVEAIAATGATGSRFRSLCDIILGIASDAAHEHLEELMGITYKSKFVGGWYQQGRVAGEAQGVAVGEARARAADILRILNSRGLRPTRAQRELIESCEDLGQLDTWFDRALGAATVTAVFED
jgi:hypothetical protein